MKFWRKYHKWAGIGLSFFLLLFALSGIVLNHREAFSSIDIPRSLLSSSYQYHNWNNAALRGGIDLDSTRTLYYGNVGCWEYSKPDDRWSDYNTGFPKGSDNRKISKVIKTNNKRLFAGTLFGLYEYRNDQWEKISLGLKHERITDLIEVDDQLHILTRSELGLLDLTRKQLHFSYLPTPAGYQKTSSLFKTIWLLHSGEILGLTGKIIVDLIALIFLFLLVTGIIWFISPAQIKRAKKRMKKTVYQKKAFRFSVKWHNKLGFYFIAFMVFTTFTGIFLRPPLLIAIANAQVKSIPYTMLDTPNAWYDQLRAIRFNSHHQMYFVSTAKGMFALTSDQKEMVPVPHQPPVSVMGINVFEEQSTDRYLVGSFSGLYLWNPIEQTTHHAFTGQIYRPPTGMARPIGEHMAAGYYADHHHSYYYDYNTGAHALNKGSFPVMPDEIKEASPLSLWNLALEIHTGRIFQDVLGAFYILIVPLTGIATLILLFSGLWIWWKKY